jgi:hypothetical protein
MRSVLGEAAGWDQLAELLASVIDEVRANTYYLLRVNGNDDVEWPAPYRRPGQEPEVPETVTLAALSSFLASPS